MDPLEKNDRQPLDHYALVLNKTKKKYSSIIIFFLGVPLIFQSQKFRKSLLKKKKKEKEISKILASVLDQSDTTT